MNKIRVLIVEDSESILLMYKDLLQKQDDIEAVGFASNKEDALTLVKTTVPDVMLVDINLTKNNDQHGIEVALETALTYPEIKIIMCSGLLNEDTIRSTMGLGIASNYILKGEPEKIPGAIRDAYKGVPIIEGEVVDIILKDYHNSLKTTMNKLTSHHINVLELFYRGYSVEQVASILKLELQSVRNLQQEIAKRCLGWQWRFRKLNTTDLAKRAKVLGLF